MKKSIMKKYASTVVKIGANVKKGQYVIITASVNQSEFTKYLVEECHCDVKAKDKYGNTPFDWVSILSHYNIVKYFAEECHCDEYAERFRIMLKNRGG